MAAISSGNVANEAWYVCMPMTPLIPSSTAVT
jgi:hypothetical protein